MQKAKEKLEKHKEVKVDPSVDDIIISENDSEEEDDESCHNFIKNMKA